MPILPYENIALQNAKTQSIADLKKMRLNAFRDERTDTR